MKLLCYALHDFAPKLVPARSQRQWMDDFPDRHPYRCLPLAIANAHGWEVLCPVPVEIQWNGGPTMQDVKVRTLKPLPGGRPVEHFCRSNFTRGIATFHVDYLFRTEPGWELMTSGPFNQPKSNASPLTGVIETDWLPYPFTMNWQIMRPGTVLFEEDEPFCTVFPIKKQALLDCQPEIHRITDDPELFRQHEAFRTTRDEFMKKFHAGDPATLKQAWQRHYFVGRHPDGTMANEHLNKLRLTEPIDLRSPPVGAVPVQAATPAQPPKRSDPRWQDDSLLNKIGKEQTALNEAGRQRIDKEGRLANPGKSTLIRSAVQAMGRDFLVMENLLSAEQCKTLCETFRAMGDKTFKSDKIDPYWNNRFIWFADIMAAQPESGKIMAAGQRQAIKLISDFYKLRTTIYADLLQMVRWENGMFMRPHADNANPDGAKHGMAHRDMAGIIYLNDDYEGGEFYFTGLDTIIKPKPGMLVGFTAGFHHEHAVLRVTSGTRYTMPFFLTFDDSHADRNLLKHMSA